MDAQRTNSRILSRDACRQEPILVVLLGKLFQDQTKAEQLCRVIDATSRFVLGGDNHLWPTFALICDAEDDVYGNSGTATDIYKLSATAKSRGWEAVVFVDELSWRQHTKITTNHEDPTLSATVVNLKLEPSESLLSPTSTFYIRRLPLITALAEAFFAEPQRPKDWSKLSQHAKKDYAFELQLHAGFYLYCPFEPPFGDEDLAEHQTQALEKCSRLPQELKDYILSDVQREESAPLQELIDTSDITDGVELIQPLIYLDDSEIDTIYQQFKTKMPLNGYHIGRWKPRRSATRRDVSRILGHFIYTNFDIIFVLNKPTDNHSLDLAVYSAPFQELSAYKFGTFHRMSIDTLDEWSKRQGHPHHGQWGLLQNSKNTEVFIDPAYFFPISLPPWYKTLSLVELSRERDRGCEPSFMRHEQHLVFYLTKHLTEEEKSVIEQFIEDDHMSGSGFTYVPWQRDTDGGIEDMFRIMKMTSIAHQRGLTTSNPCVIIFIDRQSAIDRKAIICDHEYVLDHGYSGISYGRHGYDFDSLLVNVPGNMSLGDFVDETEFEFYRDPDYSGPLQGE